MEHSDQDVATVFLLGREGGERDSTEVVVFQAVVKKSNCWTHTLLGQFKSITQYIINNKYTLNNYKYKCWFLAFTKIVSNELLQATVV